jgi:hypothetical protein
MAITRNGTVPDQSINVGYSYLLQIAPWFTTDNGPVLYAVDSSTFPDDLLPDGLALNANTGEITGSPTTANSGQIVFSATDADPDTAFTNTIQVTVNQSAGAGGVFLGTDSIIEAYLGSQELSAIYAGEQPVWPVAITAGQELLDDPGSNVNWTAPTGVNSVCIVCIGGGAADSPGLGGSARDGGGGGGLAWINDFSVNPGQQYSFDVGDVGQSSWFNSTSTVRGGGASNRIGGNHQFIAGGAGNDGADGGQADSNALGGGGGAGGYDTGGAVRPGEGGAASASGAPSFANDGNSGRFGGGGGGGGNTAGSAGNGGGTVPDGQKGNGSGGSAPSDGSSGSISGFNGPYGGGSGGNNSGAQSGCIRIIWGAGRSFPLTNTNDQ